MALIEEKMSALNEQLERLNTRRKFLLEDALPDLFEELGVEQLKLDDGRTMTLSQIVQASILADKKQAAFKWLRDNKLGALVRTNIELDFGPGELDKAQAAIKLLRAKKFNPQYQEAVNTQTLKALVRERLADGKKIPSCFAYAAIPTIKITQPKGK